MSEPLTIVQKRFGETLTFRFEDERLVRTQADRSGANNLAAFYNNIDVINWTIVKVDKLKRHRFTIWLFCGFCVIAAAAPRPPAGRPILALALAMGLGLAIAQRARWIGPTYTMFRVTDANPNVKFVKVLHDDQRERIVAELKLRWRERLRRISGEIDFANEPLKEQRKFEWLRDCGVVSTEECRDAVQRIKAAQAAGGSAAAAAAISVRLN